MRARAFAVAGSTPKPHRSTHRASPRPSPRAQVVKSERGEALWDEELSLVCTMFVNPKTGTYEPKPSVFAVKEILDPRLKERVYAEATIDLLEFAMQPGRTIKRTLPLAQGKKTLPTHLIFSVRAAASGKASRSPRCLRTSPSPTSPRWRRTPRSRSTRRSRSASGARTAFDRRRPSRW